MRDAAANRPRIEWLDAAKAIGMFLVFYGHFVESVSYADNDAALTQQKLIYAFHMPLFVLISGFLARTEFPRLGRFLKRQAATRLLPVLFFSLIMVPVGPLWQAAFGSGRHGSPGFHAHWIDDWPGLCRRLAAGPDAGQDPSCRRLWSGLSESARQAASRGAAGDSLEPATRDSLVEGLNRLLSRPDLFAAEDFAGRPLPGALAALREPDATWTEDEVRGLNLEVAYGALFPDQQFWRPHRSFWQQLGWQGISLLRGWPELNTPVWFLVCLFTLELIHFVVGRVLTTAARVAAAIPVFAVVGWLVTADVGVGQDLWFSRESVFLYAFYLAGLLLRRTSVLDRMPRWAVAALLAVSAGVALNTFQLNPGSALYKPVVLINLSQHGDPLYFGITAVAGCLAVLALARLSPTVPVLAAAGRQTLVLMGLNGFFFEYGNEVLVQWLQIPPAAGPLLFWCTVVSAGSMAACAPVVWLTNRYVPQLVGRPRTRGPLLPALVD